MKIGQKKAKDANTTTSGFPLKVHQANFIIML